MFVGRKKELQALKKLIDAKRANVALVYGRRRIGKSTLVFQAFKGKSLLVFEGLEGQSKSAQITNFIQQLAYQRNLSLPSPRPKTWREAFLYLYEELKKEPAHLFFDEFQWMANYRNKMVSELKFIWDGYFSKLPGLTLVLCGSIASFLVKKVLRSRAFYGRTDLVIHLKAFRLSETKKMLPNKGIDEIFEAQLTLGGIPKYIELLQDSPSVQLALEQLAFSPTGYLVEEYGRIFLGHFGKDSVYEAIVATLAKNPYGLQRKELAELSSATLGGTFSERLYELEAAGLISSSTPFHKGLDSKLQKYFLSDSYLRFYFNFIRPKLKSIRAGVQENIFQKIGQSAAYKAWLGREFECLCINHAKRLTKILEFSGIDFTFGPYFERSNKAVSGVQIDLLFARADNVITLCEMKYTQMPVGKKIIAEVERKVEILQKKFPKHTIQRVLITRAKPTKDLLQSGYFYKIIEATELLDDAS